MPPTTIHTPPPLDSFTALADHQSQTPSSFYGAKPVLHYHTVGVRALTSRSHVSKLPIFPEGAGAEAGADETSGDLKITEVVDAFISSENLTLFNPATSVGVSIPFPAISLHAIQRLHDPADPSKEVQGLYMQLELSDPLGVSEDDDDDIVEVTLIPGPSSPATESTTSEVQVIFEAVSNCSNLHPDPSFEEDDEMGEDGGDSRIIFEGNVGYEGISGLPGVQRGTADGGLPPPFPGSGGWITAENVSEYFDEEGNWIGEGNGESLGEGAGRVRTRDEADEDDVNGHGREDGDEHKRSRAD